MKVSLIAAVAQNGTIGRNNDLPWKIREDMRFFVQKTRGHAVIMGRRNFDSMGRPLKDRANVVVSRSASLELPGCEVVSSIETALLFAEATGEEEAYVIGGAEIYRLALPYAHCFYRTRVLADVPGDVRFPSFNEQEWRAEEVMRHEADAENEHPFVIETLTRLSPPLSYRG